MNRILVVGSVALDTVTTPFGKCSDVLGGSATYFSVSASHFSPVEVVAVVGSDFPSRHIKFLKSKKINLNGLKTIKGKTFRWEGEYSWDFGNPKTIATHLNVFSDFDPEVPREYRASKYVFLANIDPRLQKKVLNQMVNPRIVACDTMNYWIENKRNDLIRLLKEVDIFFVNESEAKELTGEVGLVAAARAMLSFGPKKVIIKKGEHGSLLFSSDSIFSTPAFLLETIFDPTGAGDTFAGGVMGYLASSGSLSEKALRKAIVYGSVMATFAVRDFSLRRLGAVKKPDIMKKFSEFKQLTQF
ncbi:MAG: PfkB family carbohydrate kinase [Omnitrophica bacterium]|nr:PfkB family carbohydrate kinase [Candidatus Omnitrophota bacterium]